MSNANFSFPGFNITGNNDNDYMRVDVGSLSHGEREYVLQMLISKNAPAHAIHSVATVTFDRTQVWSHHRQRDADYYTRLTLVDDEPVIGYVHKKSGHLCKVHPFVMFTRKLPLSVKMKIAYKRGAADYLGIAAEYTPAEEAFRQNDPTERKLAAEAKKRREAQQAERQAEEEAKRKAREEKRKAVRQAVTGRAEVTVKATTGHIMYGQPVLQEEVPHLEPKRYYVLVGQIDKDGVAQDPQKAFCAIAVAGKGIQMAHGGRDVVDFIDQTLEAPEVLKSHNFEIEGDVFEVSIYANQGDIDTLSTIGIKGVEFAAFAAGNNGKYRVFILDGTKGKTEVLKAGLLSPYGTERIAAE